ncbi:putative major facilitator, sugar transporter, major facilitator superfamily [Rosa chinensis]|uniref:Putative major facilitator, sugar transporter, major facilitator superfamily n=1 Tax=Rosa chinensis TaxID=74649 RepID=A0A2P6RL75_ROSCH|nr:monosaccharide-sensing protein 2-like [Rosa chinensis]XP_040369889.1 monosaccharide-sensing protein 2-like [Rosa chinensis]XP_040369890.1 monosaccharide-sensing protein 2-like [Rosa chinensis]XP_040369891.1 monosaccharide-sensing protein 2-like [Rosa chinensis]XP_040369892.1 monosaccharide-sensing protein 2-like [Rosa chinensis]XP_040369893.1 monosaccharide-sensing protein 2-like [Rosa chinensis]XP_040369894.1 monosaccharide-sensing protein 2-like [Rosa chinensis]XP_040369895.1 monosaccha
MRGAVYVAVAAAIGNMLQGWDNSVIAGSVLYIKKEFNLESEPTFEGLIVATSLIGATLITTFSGPASDWLGRRTMLIMSSLFFFVSGLVMFWSPNVYVLLLARLLDGFGTGLAVTLVPAYISEIAPPDIRGRLNTLPQFTGSGGMFLSYCMVFGMSLMDTPKWRLMLGVLSIPSLAYFALTILYLPESPRWLVSKGRILEAKQVLQRLNGREDVSGELALLVEGLNTGKDTSLEEYIISPANVLNQATTEEKYQIRLYGDEEGVSHIAKPITGQSLTSHHGNATNQSSISLKDPLVTLFSSVHEKLSERGGSKGSSMLPFLGSVLVNAGEHHSKHWDMESQSDDEDNESETSGAYGDDSLRSPLISRQTTSVDKDIATPKSGGSVLGVRGNTILNAVEAGSTSSIDIGGGWQLAYKYAERVSEDGKKEGVQRVYLHQESALGSQPASVVSISGVRQENGAIQAAALVSPPMVLPPEAVVKGSKWRELLEPGVKRALVVGIGLQVLEQIAGINGVLYYTPQIYERTGVTVLLSNIGLNSASASLFLSAITTFLMLPCIATSMWLMDIAGRRSLLLSTLPILIVVLALLVFGSIVNLGTIWTATISTASVLVYLCCFVMGFGVIPNILCAEIFPTRVRGLCIAICALTYWIGDIIITYSFPVMLSSIGFAGVFGIYVVGCIISWIFVYLKVPETKGMPLEVISEFFAAGVKPASDN